MTAYDHRSQQGIVRHRNRVVPNSIWRTTRTQLELTNGVLFVHDDQPIRSIANREEKNDANEHGKRSFNNT